MESSVIMFTISAILLVAVLTLRSVGFKVPQVNEMILIVGTVVIVSAAVSVSSTAEWLAMFTVVGAIVLVFAGFVGFPKWLTNFAMLLTVAGAVATLLIFLI